MINMQSIIRFEGLFSKVLIARKFSMRSSYCKIILYNNLFILLIDYFKMVSDQLKVISDHFNTIKSDRFKIIINHFKIISNDFRIIINQLNTKVKTVSSQQRLSYYKTISLKYFQILII